MSPPGPVRVPSQGPLAPSVASVTSVGYNRVIMRWYHGLCTGLLVFALSMKAMRPIIASNGVPLLQMRSVCSHSTPGREKERNKKSTRRGVTSGVNIYTHLPLCCSHLLGCVNQPTIIEYKKILMWCYKPRQSRQFEHRTLLIWSVYIAEYFTIVLIAIFSRSLLIWYVHYNFIS